MQFTLGKSTANAGNERAKMEEMLISQLETVLTEMPGMLLNQIVLITDIIATLKYIEMEQ